MCIALFQWLAAPATAGDSADAHEQPVVSDWLLLGPTPRDRVFDDPPAELGEITEGATVTLPGGATREWQSWEADSSGVMRLGQFSAASIRPDEKTPGVAAGDDSVVYAACRIRASKKCSRRFYTGFDDGARMWVDGQLVLDDRRPGWLNPVKHSMVFDLEANEEKLVLLEVHNWTGSFLFTMRAGYQMSGRLVFADGASPVQRKLISARQSTGQSMTTISDDSGRFLLRGLPYGEPVALSIEGRKLPPIAAPDLTSPDISNSVLEIRPTPSSELSIKLLPMGTSVPTALCETTYGQILVANELDRRIHVFDGERLYPHPVERIRSVTNGLVTRLAVDKQGSIWVGTVDDGLYRIPESLDEEVQYWPAKVVGDRCNVIFESRKGVWITFNVRSGPDRTHFFNHDTGDLSQPESLIGTRIQAIAETPEEGVLATVRRHVVRLPTKEKSKLDDETRAIDGLAATPDGCVWASGASIYCFNPDDSCTTYEWLETGNNDSSIVAGVDGTVWASCRGSVYIIADDRVQRVQLPESAGQVVDLIVSRAGSLLAIIKDVGVYEIRNKRSHVVDYRHGINDCEFRIIDGNGDHLLLSTLHVPTVIRVNQVDPVDVTAAALGNVKSGVGTVLYSPILIANGKDEVLAFPWLTGPTGVYSLVAESPFIKRGDKPWTEITGFTFSESHTTCYYFCDQLRDGRCIIGTDQGLFVLQGDNVEAITLFPDHARLMAIVDTPQGLYGAVENGPIVRRSKSGETTVYQFDDNEFPSGSMPFVNSLVDHNGTIVVTTSKGLFIVDQERNRVRRVRHPQLRSRNIAGAASVKLPAGRQGLWVATRNSGLFMMADEDVALRIPLEHTDDVINGIAIDALNRAWLATNHGAVVYTPAAILPILAVRSIRYEGEESYVEGRPLSVSANREIEVLVSCRGGADSVGLRYQVDGGPWVRFSRDNSSVIPLKFGSSGLHEVTIVGVDCDLNESRPIGVTFDVFIPFWERPAVRGLLIALLLIALVAIAVLLAFYMRARSAKRLAQIALMEEEHRARQAAEAASRERELLLARVCHDLRSPIGGVSVSADLLRQSPHGNDEAIELLDDCVGSMTYLTDQLLTYARSVGKTETRVEEIVVARLLDRLQHLFIARFRGHPASLTIHTAPDAPRTIRADKGVLSELLSNLIDNACKYTKEGRIDIRYEALSDHLVQFQVKDSGAGIPAEMIATLLEPFARGHQSQDGFGLGLFICDNLARKLQGKLKIESDPGEGTTITLQLPLNAASPAEAAVTASGPDKVG
ncbi:MAG: ATP-binding protein [Planctomycetaceae bacterium]